MGKINTVLVQLAAAEATKTLVAAPTAAVGSLPGTALRIHRIKYLSETASGNAITIAIGATEFGIIDNLAANGEWDTEFHEDGVLGPVATALIASQTAGPKGKFWIDYSID